MDVQIAGDDESVAVQELVRRARAGDMDAARIAVERVKRADWILESRDREARGFRIGAGPKAVDLLRNTNEQTRAALRELFRLSPIYRTAGFKI